MTETIQLTPSYIGTVFGIELEIEAEGLYEPEEHFNEDGDCYETIDPEIPFGWVREHEESIQGVEIICDRPYDLVTLTNNINRLFVNITQQGYTPRRTARGSTHVHVNAADLSWEQLRSFVMASVWAEPFLIEHAGIGRKGNLFAQSYEHTPMGWSPVVQWYRMRCIRHALDTHYMATSFSPLGSLGSVEFRMGPSSRTAEEAIAWLNKIAIVAEAGRNCYIDDQQPEFLSKLMEGLPDYTVHRLLHKARRHASHLWQDLNEPYTPPKPRRRNGKSLAAMILDDYQETTNGPAPAPTSLVHYDAVNMQMVQAQWYSDINTFITEYPVPTTIPNLSGE